MTVYIPNGATWRAVFKAYQSVDHLTSATGKTIAITISKNGAGFGNPSAGATNATEIANGWYYVDLSATDTGTNGPLIVYGTASGTDNIDLHHYVVAATNAGFTALPATACTTNGSLITSGTGTAQLSVTSGVAAANAQQFSGQTITCSGGVTVPAATLASTTNITAGAITTVGTLTTYTGNTPQTGDNYARLGAPVGSSISADIAAAPTTLLDKTSGVETSVTLRQALRIMLAALGGKATGLDIGTPVYRDVNDTKDRISATTDTYGNRSAVTYDVT